MTRIFIIGLFQDIIVNIGAKKKIFVYGYDQIWKPRDISIKPISRQKLLLTPASAVLYFLSKLKLTRENDDRRWWRLRRGA